MEIGILLRSFLGAGIAVTQSGSKFGEGCHFRQFLFLNSAVFLTGCLTIPAESLLGKIGFNFTSLFK